MVFDQQPSRGTINFMDGQEMFDRESVDAREKARAAVLVRVEAGLRTLILDELGSGYVLPEDAEGMTTEELIEELTDKELESR